MSSKYSILSLLFFFIATTVAIEARGFEELSDQKLNVITAGSVDSATQSGAALKRIPFRYVGNHGNVDGEILVIPTTEITNQSSLQLMDNAQSNLRSLINVNAVNSPVQILLNLNINLNSTIGHINQLNHLLPQR